MKIIAHKKVKDNQEAKEPVEQKDLEAQPNNPLHGVKLKDLLNFLIDEYGWEGLADRIDINCFKSNPTVGSSLKFLRRTAWARNKVERLYLDTI